MHYFALYYYPSKLPLHINSVDIHNSLVESKQTLIGHTKIKDYTVY